MNRHTSCGCESGRRNFFTLLGLRYVVKATGDCLAPWALLAEATAAAGRTREEVNQAFEQGIMRSSDRPGYFKPVAEALTYAMRAQHETSKNN